jgi:alpha-ketoglutaric semialdehyde dehydrogenase
MELSGKSLIGSADGRVSQTAFRAVAPATGQELEPRFYSASRDEVERAAALSEAAFPRYAALSGRDRGAFLRTVAGNLEASGVALVERAGLETALPAGRLQGELTRTSFQLRLFAGVIEDGSWTAPRIDRALPDRKPASKPDLRSMLRPIGPVAVFGASNFPLAFSVAGGDTASALAAGNPVIVKAHPAHPGTSELAGQAIRKSVRECGLPEGVFSLLFDSGTAVGAQLVEHRLIRAGAFTGSYAAGRALFDLAMKRPDPIPFYAEMASTNPLFILPGALAANADRIASGLYQSFTLGSGQFCTKPGLVFVPEGAAARQFVTALAEKVSASPPATLLSGGIAASFRREAFVREPLLRLVARGNPPEPGLPAGAAVALYEAGFGAFRAEVRLAGEHFGPSTLLVQVPSQEGMLDCAGKLEGHLTASIHGTAEDLAENATLVRVLERKVGRLVFNGFPTGVEVTHAMVHGGPFPASSDSRTTSVGSLAILRFARPVCYQDFPEGLLPAELQNRNPLGLWRMVDGELTKEALC